jgi:hypothetical protein
MQVEGCESVVGQCNEDSGSLSCGPYQIKEPYYIDCYSPGSGKCMELKVHCTGLLKYISSFYIIGWQACTMYMECYETCVQAYMQRYGTWCTNGVTPTCKDYAQIHNGGPTGCRMDLPVYWGRVEACCNRVGGC